MASLAETMDSNKKLMRSSSGVLSETPTDIQGLAANAGLPAAPTTPAGGGLIGANPDQQKMMGVPAQKQTAQAASLGSEGGLAEATRRGQARSQMTTQEQGSKEKEAKAAGLSDVQARAQSFIDSATSRVAGAGTSLTQGTAIQSSGAGAKLGVTDPATATKVDQLVSEYGQLTDAVAQHAKLADIANLIPGVDANTLASKVTALVADKAAVGTAAAKGIADTATVRDLLTQPGGLGYSEQDLSKLLGVDPATLATMSIPDLQKHIASLEDQEFSRVQNLQHQANDPNIGPAERAAAQSALREMSAAGVRASEASFHRIDEAVKRGDQVSFGGQTYKVGDLLNDATISSIVADFISKPNSEQAKALRADPKNAGFIKFINDNLGVLTAASASLAKSADVIKDVAAQRNQLVSGSGITDPKVLDVLMPGRSKLSSTLGPVPPILTMAQGNPQIQDALRKMTPDMAKELQGKTADEIASYQIGTRGGIWDKWQEGQEIAKANQERLNYDPHDVDATLNTFFSSKGVTPDKIEKDVQASREDYALGIDDEHNDQSFNDTYVDRSTGKINYDRMNADMRGETKYSLSDVLAGKKAAGISQHKLPTHSPSAGTPEQNSLRSKLHNALGDNKLTADEVGGMDFSDAELGWFNSPAASHLPMDDKAHGVVMQKVHDMQTRNTNNLINKFPVDDNETDQDSVNDKWQKAREYVTTNGSASQHDMAAVDAYYADQRQKAAYRYQQMHAPPDTTATTTDYNDYSGGGEGSGEGGFGEGSSGNDGEGGADSSGMA